MNGRTVWQTALAFGLLAAMPSLAAAQTTVYGGATFGETACSGATLTPCVEFTLVQTGEDTFEFWSEYLGSTSDDPGVMTATGLYDPNKKQEPSFNFTGITAIAPTGWNVTDCEHLNGDGPVLFQACSDGDGGVGNGIAPGGGIVKFSFTYTGSRDLLADLANGDLGARAHIQSFGSADCSLKPDSRVGVVSGPESGLESCNGQVVPEPMTVILLGMGLLGVGAATVKSRAT